MRGVLVFVAVFAVALMVVVALTAGAASNTSIGDCAAILEYGEEQTCR